MCVGDCLYGCFHHCFRTYFSVYLVHSAAPDGWRFILLLTLTVMIKILFFSHMLLYSTLLSTWNQLIHHMIASEARAGLPHPVSDYSGNWLNSSETDSLLIITPIMPPPLVLQLSSACPLEGPSASCSSCWVVPSPCMGKYPYQEPSLTLDSHIRGPFAVFDTVVNAGVKLTPIHYSQSEFVLASFLVCLTALVSF